MPDYHAINRDYIRTNMELPKLYLFEFLGRTLIGSGNVYAPNLFEDTAYFAGFLSTLVEGRFLEIGTGTGAIAVTCAARCKYVLATDINSNALKICNLNAQLSDCEEVVHTRYSDVFEAVEATERFDYIFWNTPFGFGSEGECENVLHRAIFDPFYSGITAFLRDGLSYLQPAGRLLFGFSRSSGDWKKLEEIARNASVTLSILQEWEMPPDPLANNDKFFIAVVEVEEAQTASPI